MNQALSQAESLAKKGDRVEAQKIFRAVLQSFPNNKRAQQGLSALSRPQQNISSSNPPQEALAKLVSLYNHGRLSKVVDLAQSLTEKYPEAFFVWNILGVAKNGLGRVEEASETFKKVTRLNPFFSDGFNNLGATLKEQGKLEGAVEAFQKALSLKPDFAEAYNNMGNALKEQGNLAKAIEAYNKVISLKPSYAEAYYNLGIALNEQGELGKAIVAYKKTLSLKPDFAEAYNNMGSALKEQGKLDQSIEAYNKAISLKPDYAGAYNNMGDALSNQGELVKAIEAYKKALSLKPDYDEARAQKLFQQAKICDWQAILEESDLIPELGIGKRHIAPFSLLALEDAPERHRLRSEQCARIKFPVQDAKPIARPPHMPERLRIGYFSSDYKEHPVAQLMAGVIERHDRIQFEVFGYSLGPPKMDAMRERLARSFDLFRDFSSLADGEICEVVREDKIDIAVDLTGYTQNSRSGIFSHRIAPVQINYLGYPGTMGAECMDYIIADERIIPKEFQEFYTEKPIYLPHQYQAQDDTLPISDETPSRSDLGLPDQGFVFCAINNNYKITPREFDVWMRLLQAVEGSVLWLLESNSWVRGNLLKEANARGVGSERLVFAQKVSHEKYLAQFRKADLFLDTFTYNAGATASNALWAGLPVLTKCGKGYATRMASSLLSAIDLPELITTSEQAYEELAISLAKNPERLVSIRQRLAANRLSKPLFNTDLFIKHLQIGYQQAYQRYFEGNEPEPIYVSEHLHGNTRG